MNSTAQPVQLDLDRERELRVRWSDGQTVVYPLSQLRAACPCAGCRERREHEGRRGGLPVVPDPQTQRVMNAVDRAELVGHYAIRLYWRDGHDTGIYDFRLLRRLNEVSGADPE